MAKEAILSALSIKHKTSVQIGTACRTEFSQGSSDSIIVQTENLLGLDGVEVLKSMPITCMTNRTHIPLTTLFRYHQGPFYLQV